MLFLKTHLPIKKHKGIKSFISTKKYNNKSFTYGLGVKQPFLLTNFQVNSINKIFHKWKTLFYIEWCIWPTIYVTKKSQDSRMGAGKGNLKYKVCYCRPYTKLLNIKNMNKSLDLINQFLRQISFKLPVPLYTILY